MPTSYWEHHSPRRKNQNCMPDRFIRTKWRVNALWKHLRLLSCGVLHENEIAILLAERRTLLLNACSSPTRKGLRSPSARRDH